ncbi:hypothetical protein BD413DRAFT_33589 [Trametes elegans]|nr:hypothetical protein BD413DRAFT_33589 [Trametes elegans]
MESKSYIFDPRPSFPLFVTIRQYWTPQCSPDDPDALTLVFTHGLTGSNATLVPLLEDLFALLRLSGQVKIRDAWGIDLPNHGHAARLNERELMWGYNIVFPAEEYARAVHLCLAGLGRGVDVDFSSRKLVGVGNCLGCIALVLSQTYQPALPYVSMILVEPALSPHHTDPKSRIPLLPTEGMLNKREIWPSREAAYNELRQRRAWTHTQDLRVLEQLVQHDLLELPTAEYPDITDGVTLNPTKSQQLAIIRDELSSTKAFRYLPHLCASIPVHLVFATLPYPFLPAAVKEGLMSEGTQGRHASVQYVANVGHPFSATHPQLFSDAVWNALCMLNGCAFAQKLRSRL